MGERVVFSRGGFLRLPIFLLVGAMLSGCVGDGEESAQSTSDGESARRLDARMVTPVSKLPSAMTERVTAAGGANLLTQVVVDDITKEVPGQLDYKLSIIVCGGAQGTLGQEVKLSYAGGNMLADKANFGMAGYGQCRLNTDSKFKVRLPDGQTFDPAKLQVNIAGSTTPRTSPTKLIKLDLYSVRGRASHPAMLPINTQFPTIGESVFLNAKLEGVKPGVTFTIKTPSGTSLLSGPMKEPDTGVIGYYNAQMVVPNSDFIIQIDAVSNDGQALSWVTEKYQPRTGLLKIDMSSGAVFSGTVQQITPAIKGIAETGGKLYLRVLAPAGVSANWSVKTIDVAPGASLNIPITMTADPSLAAGSYRVFLQYRYALGKESLASAKIVSIK